MAKVITYQFQNFTITVTAAIKLKRHRPIFQNLVFCFICRIITLNMEIFTFWFNRSSHLNAWVGSNSVFQWPIFYGVDLIIITLTRQVLINFFQMDNFSAIKFLHESVMRKNKSFFVISRLPKFEKKINLGCFTGTVL